MPIFSNNIFVTNRKYIPSSDAIHFLQFNGYCVPDIDTCFVKSKRQSSKLHINVKILNWYTINYNLLEKYIVCKCKIYGTDDIVNLIFDSYKYYLFSIDELNGSEELQNIKRNIDNNTTIKNKYILLHDCSIITNIYNTFKWYELHKINNRPDFRSDFIIFKTHKTIKTKSAYINNYKDIRWFYVLNNIDSSGSYKLNLTNMYTIKTYNNSVAYYIGDNDIKSVFGTPITPDIYYITSLSLDIECKHDGYFPTADKFPISHIVYEIYYENPAKQSKIMVFINSDIIKNNTDYMENMYLCNDISDFDNILYGNHIYIITPEIYIIQFMQYLLQQNIDIILSYNGHRFDIPYINTRREKYLLKKLTCNNVAGNNELIFGDVNNNIEIYSRGPIIFLDIYNYVKSVHSNLDNYKLETISRKNFNCKCDISYSENRTSIFIKPICKDDIQYNMFYKALRSANYCFINNGTYKIKNKSNIIGSITELYDKKSTINSLGHSFEVAVVDNTDLQNIEVVYIAKDDVDIGNAQTYKNYNMYKAFEIGYYCIHDTILCRLHFEYEMIYSRIDAFSSQFLLPQYNAFTYRSSTNVTGMLLKCLYNNKTILLQSKSISNDYDYDGGKVFNPKKLYIKGPIAIFDFKSLYPSIIILGNMSPEKIIAVIESDDELINKYIEYNINKKFKYPNYLVSKIILNNSYNYIITTLEQDGIITKLLKEGMTKRDEYKLLANQNRNNYLIYSLYDSLQYAIKIFINSIYGLLGSRNFIFKSKKCAEMCTAMSRECIIYTYNILNNSYYMNNTFYFNKIDKFVSNDKINNKIVSNLNIPDKVIMNIIYGDTDSLFIELSFECINNLSDLNLLDMSDMLCKKLEFVLNKYMFPNILKLEYESLNTYMIMPSKKKYITLQYTLGELKYISKGLSIIRRDYCNYHKQFIQNIIDTIIDNIKSNNMLIENKLYDFILGTFSDLVNQVNNKKISIKNFIITRKYTPNLALLNDSKQLVLKYNASNHNDKIIPGSRYGFIYAKKVSNNNIFNRENLKDVNKQMIIIDDKNIDIIQSEYRLSIEIYLYRMLSDVRTFVNNSIIIDRLKCAINSLE